LNCEARKILVLGEARKVLVLGMFHFYVTEIQVQICGTSVSYSSWQSCSLSVKIPVVYRPMYIVINGLNFVVWDVS